MDKSSIFLYNKKFGTIQNKEERFCEAISAACFADLRRIFIIGTGGSVFVYSNLGADPLNLLSQGAAGIFHLPVGTVNSLLQLLFFLILLLIARRRIGLGTIIGIFLIGFVMNLWALLLSPWLEQAPLVVRCLGVVIAPVLVGIGVAMVQTADLGMVPNDLLQFVIGLLLGGVLGLERLYQRF